MDFYEPHHSPSSLNPPVQRRVYSLGHSGLAGECLTQACVDLELPLVPLESPAELPSPSAQARGCIWYHNVPSDLGCLAELETLASDFYPFPIVLVLEPGNMSLAVKAMRAGVMTALEEPLDTVQIRSVFSNIWREEETRLHQYFVHTELKQRVSGLTSDELEVLRRILEGKPNKVIRKELDIGLRTTELRRSKIMKKMKANSLAELVQISVYAGIAPEPRVARDSVVPPEQV